jgi:GNAT superfamily N-acetyltransferase
MRLITAPYRWRYQSLDLIRMSITSMPIVLFITFWVDEKYRKQGTARLLMETSEREAKKLGCKSVQLEWDNIGGKPFVLEWYKRLGYRVMARNENGSLLLVKEL